MGERRKKQIVIIDGQGGGFGRALIEKLRQQEVRGTILAVGTNSMATSAMLRAGADAGATGENAAVVASRSADIIAGPMGIVMADAMLGECTAAIAAAVARSDAARVLVPVTRCRTYVAGAENKTLGQYVEDAACLIRGLLEEDETP